MQRFFASLGNRGRPLLDGRATAHTREGASISLPTAPSPLVLCKPFSSPLRTFAVQALAGPAHEQAKEKVLPEVSA